MGKPQTQNKVATYLAFIEVGIKIQQVMPYFAIPNYSIVQSNKSNALFNIALKFHESEYSGNRTDEQFRNEVYFSI